MKGIVKIVFVKTATRRYNGKSERRRLGGYRRQQLNKVWEIKHKGYFSK